MSLIGILITNTGTPSNPTPGAVRQFLKEFLSDRRVIKYPRWLWVPFLHAVILNVRPRRSAHLYRKIWTEWGSPLLNTVQDQSEGIKRLLAMRTKQPLEVAIGMRYGEPSIRNGLQKLNAMGAERFLIFPLFPQYSGTTTGSSFDAVFEELGDWRKIPETRTIHGYHDHSAYISALTNSIRSHWDDRGTPERLLFSFHGIPLSYAQDGDPYESQCFQTAELVASGLGLGSDEWEVSFQSRFGPQEWLKPYTHELLVGWGRSGLKRVDVICPGFSADCLETIYEIDQEGRYRFQNEGGGEFHYIPALNSDDDHLTALSEIIATNLRGWIDGNAPNPDFSQSESFGVHSPPVRSLPAIDHH